MGITTTIIVILTVSAVFIGISFKTMPNYITSFMAFGCFMILYGYGYYLSGRQKNSDKAGDEDGTFRKRYMAIVFIISVIGIPFAVYRLTGSKNQ
jgi:uncharacterized membrane protein YozB (DUF420 family)